MCNNLRWAAICSVSILDKIVSIAMIKRCQYDPQPLPQTIDSRFRTFLFGLGLSLVMLAVGVGIIWSGLEQPGWEFALRFLFGLWPLFISGLFLYLSFYFTWRLTLLLDRIVIRFPFHKREFPLEQLQTARLVTLTSTRRPVEDSVVLVLSFENGRPLRITQQEMPIPLALLLEMLLYHPWFSVDQGMETYRYLPTATQNGRSNRQS